MLRALLIANALAGQPETGQPQSDELERDLEVETTTRARSRSWRLWTEGASDVPLYVGARIEAELPRRIRVWTSLGVVPTAYMEIVDAAAQSFGGYNDQTSDVIVSTLESSLVWRIHAGWRPFQNKGWGIDAGYSLATLGGSTNGAELLSAALGRTVPDEGSTEFDVVSTLHLLGLELSHRWSWRNGLSLRAALGFATTVAADTTVTPRGDPVRARLSRGLADDLEAYLDDVYTSFVHTPYIGLGFGYDVSRLFRPGDSD